MNRQELIADCRVTGEYPMIRSLDLADMALTFRVEAHKEAIRGRYRSAALLWNDALDLREEAELLATITYADVYGKEPEL